MIIVRKRTQGAVDPSALLNHWKNHGAHSLEICFVAYEGQKIN